MSVLFVVLVGAYGGRTGVGGNDMMRGVLGGFIVRESVRERATRPGECGTQADP